MSQKQDMTFINGMLAEKAKLATQLLAEILAEMPDALLFQHQDKLSQAAKSLQEIHNDLRRAKP